MRAMNMLGKAEEQYTSLINKKTTVENDKSKIRKVIEELDVKKKAELRAAWEKVNKDFGSIFAMLLPGKKHIIFGTIHLTLIGMRQGGFTSLIILGLDFVS